MFALGAIELWAAISAGFVLQLHPLETGMVAATGAILGVLIVLKLGERMRTILMHNRKSEKKKLGRIHRIWDHYGVEGLGMLAPLFVGAPLGAVLGITLGAPVKRLLLWMSLGIILWSTVFTLIGLLGLAGIEALAR
ncbi:MAG: small multi-drug export protein [Candidatus Methanoperedens sp.]|nr:small multi-drug export protein [Candidatus Methanoperedens sp.]